MQYLGRRGLQLTQDGLGPYVPLPWLHAPLILQTNHWSTKWLKSYSNCFQYSWSPLYNKSDSCATSLYPSGYKWSWHCSNPIQYLCKSSFQKPRSISLYRKTKWDGMKQALEAYHQVMLESGKYSCLNAVQLWVWPSLYSHFSHKHKFIPSKLSRSRNNLHWVNQNSNGLLDKETQLFRNIGNQANLLIEKSFLTSSTYSESPSNFLINPTFRIFLMWPQMNDLEVLYHSVLIWPMYNDLRTTCIKKYYFDRCSSVYKFVELFKSTHKSTVKKS